MTRLTKRGARQGDTTRSTELAGQAENGPAQPAKPRPVPARRDRRDAGTVARRQLPPFDPPPHRPAGAAALALPPATLPPAVASPRTLDGSTLRLPPRIGGMDDVFLGIDLPRLNNEVSANKLDVRDFVEAVRDRISESDLNGLARIGDRLDPDSANFILGGLGAVASSIVRHVRVETGDVSTSEGIKAVPGLERALMAFGGITRRAPRDNHDTTWVLGLPATFTGTSDERRFGSAVREANRLLGASERLLLPLRSGAVQLVDAVELLDSATVNVKEYALVQSDLATNAFPTGFLEMRKYLGAYEVGGRLLEGPNATYSGGWTSFEVALGLLDDFRSIALHRTQHMSVTDRAHIEASTRLPTVCEILAASVGLTGPLGEADPGDLGRRFDVAPASLRRALAAIRALAKATAVMAGTHVGAIKMNLVAPVSAMTEEERSRLGVSPDGGVSGTPLERTYQQRTRRLTHPLIRTKTSVEGEPS